MSEKEQILQPQNKNFKEQFLKCKLEDLFSFFRGKGLNKDSISIDGKECILYGQLYTEYLNKINQITLKTNVEIINPILSKKGDIILPGSGESKYDISNSAVVPYNDIIYGGDLIILRPKKDIDSLYFSYLITNILKKDIYRISQGVSIIHLPIDDLSKIIVKYHRLENQHKISFFLSLIDEKISLIKNKVNILKKYKKGLIKHLLSNGIKMEKFIKYIEYISKTSFASNDGKEVGKYPFYINSTDGSYKFIDSYTHEGKHLILNTGGQAFTQISDEKFSAMSDNLIIKIKKRLFGVYYFLKANENKINYVGFQGTGIKHLDQNWLKRQYVILPQIPEEKLEILEININKFVDNHVEQFKKLHQLKMQLMKDLFI